VHTVQLSRSPVLSWRAWLSNSIVRIKKRYALASLCCLINIEAVGKVHGKQVLLVAFESDCVFERGTPREVMEKGNLRIQEPI
jgi:hypothetical protein